MKKDKAVVYGVAIALLLLAFIGGYWLGAAPREVYVDAMFDVAQSSAANKCETKAKTEEVHCSLLQLKDIGTYDPGAFGADPYVTVFTFNAPTNEQGKSWDFNVGIQKDGKVDINEAYEALGL